MPQENANLDSADNENGPSATDLIKRIKAGEVDPKDLLPERRRSVVQVLMDENWPTTNIAQFLKTNDRMIQRDKKDIFESRAIVPDPKFTEQMAGQVFHDAEMAIQRIMSVARLDRTSEAVRIDAYHRCFQIRCQLFEKLQSAGFIKTATQKIEADITHSLDLEQIENEIVRLKQIEQSTQKMENLAQFEEPTPRLEEHNGN